MSTAAATSLRERARGKWQIPALFLAGALLAGAILRLRSVQVHYPVEAYLEQLAARVADGYHTSAIDYADRLLKRKDLSAAHRAAVHLQLARARYLRAEREKRTTSEEAAVVQREYAAAYVGGAPRLADDVVRWAESFLWSEDSASALAHLEDALSVADPPALAIRRRIIELSLGALDRAAADVLPLLDSFIRDAGEDLDASHWAAATQIDLLSAAGRDEEAVVTLDALRGRFEHSRRYGAYLSLVALVQYRTGQYDEAEAQLRDLRNTLGAQDDLYAMTGWLLGRVVLSDGRPQRPEEALSFFRDVVRAVPRSLYASASRLGMAESLAALGRYGESLIEFRQVTDLVTESKSLRASALLATETIRATATTIGERLRREGELEPALQFYAFASSLVDRKEEEQWAQYLQILGDLRVGLARELREKVRTLSSSIPAEDVVHRESDARYLLVEAAESFSELAGLRALNESQSAEAVWRAANLFEEGNATRRAVTTLEGFLRQGPPDDQAPRVLLRLGQARQSLGLYQEAIDAYQENLRRFPRTPDAGSGLIPLARCYRALGPTQTEMAVRTLDVILRDSPIFTPEAPEFRDALFLLGDIHSSEGQLEKSIAVLEEALERYPSDPRALRARFLLADAYRQSAEALKRESEDPQAAADRPRMRSEASARFKRATELFAGLVEALGPGGESPTEAEGLLPLLSKHARLYQADCLFQLGRFAEAVALYEMAAFIYRDEPSALSAYVQIINCRLSLGESAEARTALRRARYLLQIMPETAFEGPYAGQSRREWERYMNWLERADLF